MTDQFLMCSPEYFGVQYTINPWMKDQVGRVDTARARRQWDSFHDPINRVADVALIAPHREVPDMVFTANAGLARGSRFVPSRFKHPERQAEEPYFTQWFREHGFDILSLPGACAFEGAGDALFQGNGDLLWTGYGFRTDAEALPLLEQLLDCRVVPLRLIDPRFYHLDTCLCPLQNGSVLYYPPAFDEPSRGRILEHASNLIPVSDEDALNFACNAVLADHTLFMHGASADLKTRLEQEGYSVQVHPVGEFLKAGGANKCLTIALR